VQPQGKSNILVSTDVAARGLHINRLQYVVNYDFPLNLEQYCHRVGRTGRQGKEGQAYSLLSRNMSMLAADLIKLLEVRASKLV
jgi:superfamily II DNA/RNA helicase